MSQGYQFFFKRAGGYADNGLVEKALADYYNAFFVGRNSADSQLIGLSMLDYRAKHSFNEYAMNIAIRDIIREKMLEGSYDEALGLLQWLFNLQEKKYRKPCICEETMLQYIMLETALSEKMRLSSDTFETQNTCVLYSCSEELFHGVYMDLKHAVRRLWMGWKELEDNNLYEIIKNNRISPELLAVVTKYSINDSYWVDMFYRVKAYLHDNMLDPEEYFDKFCKIIERTTTKEQKKCHDRSDKQYEVNYRRIYADKTSNECMTGSDKDNNKIAFIICTNNKKEEEECLFYIKHLKTPTDMQVEVISVWNANSMCSGYNYAMALTDARYKIYIHHDCFFIKDDVLIQLIDIFNSSEEWKMLGVAGTTKLSGECWWHTDDISVLRFNLYQDRIMETTLSKTPKPCNKVDKAEAIDGVMIATSEDLMWREDLFDGWHFYDISQCFEYRAHGYTIGLINDSEPWIMHETTTRNDRENKYEKYAEIFKKRYL